MSEPTPSEGIISRRSFMKLAVATVSGLLVGESLPPAHTRAETRPEPENYFDQLTQIEKFQPQSLVAVCEKLIDFAEQNQDALKPLGYEKKGWEQNIYKVSRVLG